VGKSADDVRNALTPVIGEGPDALEILADPTSVSNDDLIEALVKTGPKIPLGVFRKHLPALRGAAPAAPAPAAGAAPAALNFSILPPVPDEPSFIAALKIGGVLKVGPTDVISAVKAAHALQVGLFGLPTTLMRKMEDFALKQEEPCGPDFYELQKLLTQKRYGEILSALGVPGSFVSAGKKTEFFTRLHLKLWPALKSFNAQLTAWQQAWMSGMSNPGMMVMAMAAGTSGGIMPPGMMAPPDTSNLRASAEEVINEINRVFAGPGIPVARALAFDATRIMTILNKPTLPTQVGAASKDQMLKELGITVGADVVRMEQSITRYALAIMSLAEVPADAEVNYLGAMLQLGLTIPWDKLGAGPVPTAQLRKGGRRAGIGLDDDEEGDDE
jgi:hypothetical protein